MLNLLSNFFSFSRIKNHLKNKQLSLFMFYDKSSFISEKARVERFVVMRESQIDKYSYVGHNSNLLCASVGKFCSISRSVNIGLGTHPTNFPSTSPLFFHANNGTGQKWVEEDIYDGRPKRVFIGNDVWVGMNATITGGIKIGNGAIIAAHAVVTKDIPPYAIAGGVPAKVIKFRFSSEIIATLEALSWWDLPDDFLKQNVTFFQHEFNESNIQLFRDKIIEADLDYA